VVTDPAQSVVLVPASSVVTFAGVTKVLGVSEGRVVEKRIRPGRKVGDAIEVLDGLAAGEAVIVEPGGLTSGQAVAVGS